MRVSSIEVEVPVSRFPVQRGRVTPTVSVIISSRHDRAQLHALLAQLVPQCSRADAQLLVARPGSAGDSAALSKVFPGVSFVHAPADATDQQLRNLAMTQTSADVVLFADDRRPLERGWVESLRRRLSADPEAQVESSAHRLVGDRAVHCDGAAAADGQAAGPAGSAAAAPAHPELSVIVPVHQGAKVLPQSLAALVASDFPRACWELIVVDDASTDDSALAAAPFADVVVRIPTKPYGPAYARNRGTQLSRGHILVFVDADVSVHPETLRRFAAAFDADPQVSAISGSYDDCPPGRGVVSRYRNLLQHFQHQQGAGPVDRFWACCGAVRSGVFTEAGMYDEWRFRRPQIEDIELGRRIRALGHQAVLRPDIQATHLKRWTLGSMIATAVHDRGVPWMRLDAEEAGRATRLRPSVQAVNTGYTWLAIAVAALAVYLREGWYLLAAAAPLVPVLYNNRRQYAFFARKCGLPFALAAVPLDLLNYAVNGVALVVGWALREVVGEPKPDATVQAFAEVGIKTWPPVPTRGIARTSSETRSV
jgi:glycosyltransferase involved in cell wall biosynthesis